MQDGLSAQQQITALRHQLAQRDAVIVELTSQRDRHQAEQAEVAFFKAQLTTALLEIQQLKVQLEALRRQRFGRSSEKLDQAIAQLELRLEDLEENLGEQIAANPRRSDPDAEPSSIDKVRRITHVACMAHARRYFFDVFASTKSPIAEQALRRIQALYRIEAEINGKTIEHRWSVRQARSKPLLKDFHSWAQTQRRRVSGKTPLGKAFQYALGRWDALTRYIEDGRLSIDNNLSERLIRGITLTRKNFLFLGSDRGGDRAAILYTIIETATLNDLHPEQYLAAVLDRLA